MHQLATFLVNILVQEEFFLGGLTHAYGTGRLSGNADKYQSTLRNIPKERRSPMFCHWATKIISPTNFVLWPTNAQLSHKISHSYIFRHYRVILWELIINALPSYALILSADVGNTVYT